MIKGKIKKPQNFKNKEFNQKEITKNSDQIPKMSARGKRKQSKAKAEASQQHHLQDTLSFLDKAGQVPAGQREKYIEFVVDLADKDRDETSQYSSAKQWMDRVLLLRKKHKIHPRKAQIRKVYEGCLKDGTIIDANLKLEQYLQSRASRSLSGILVIAVLMSPYPIYLDQRTGKVKQQRFSCAHNCYYCPNEPAMPRSYLSSEPAVSRALRVGFDAIDQFYARANTLQKLGHEIDKIELLVLGGTFCQFPAEYQEQFMRDLFWAANTFYDGIKDFRLKRPRKSLAQEIKIHETATKCRIVGVTLETRPDTITIQSIQRLREMGATRLQIGVQHTDDKILKHINRGCYNDDTIRAVRLLKNACYKIDIHLMPNLPGSTAERDTKMFNDLMSDDLIQCDQWKVYPCQTVDYSIIQKWYENGTYKPYSLEQLMEVIIAMKAKVSPWIRLNRIFRSLPEQHITSGITMSNFRQHMYQKMQARGLRCSCVRCREIGTHIRRNNSNIVAEKLSQQSIVLKKRQYKSSGGDEIFISMESEDGTVLMGFVRLRLPAVYIKPADRQAMGLKKNEAFLFGWKCGENGKYGKEAEYAEMIETFPALYQAALVREAHVYGAKQGVVTGTNKTVKDKNEIRETLNLTGQSKGYGSLMMQEAETIARDKGYSRVCVIAGVGARLFYRLKLGYKSAGSYMVKDFNEAKLGRAARGDVDTINISFLRTGLGSAIAICTGLYVVSSFLSTLLTLVLTVLCLGYLNFLHFYKIEYGKTVNKSLLTLSKLALLLLDLSILFKVTSFCVPHIKGMPVPPLVMDLFGDNLSSEEFSGDSGDCYCKAYWSMTLVSYVSAFYLLKLIYHKRVIIMIQNPMFGNDKGSRKVPPSITGLLLGQIFAFSLCQFLAINYTSSHCTDESTTMYDQQSPFGCHDTFEAVSTWVALLAITFDSFLFSLFCSKWYSTMLIFMEEMATSLLVQFALVMIAMASCVINACSHMLLLYFNRGTDRFDSFVGTPSFCVDALVMAACLVLSFTDSQKHIMTQLGISDLKQYYQSLENLGYSLYIM